MSFKGKILMHGETDIGSVRDHNEDAIACDEDIALAVLADGMGGHRGGEMASAITVSTVLEAVTEKIKNISPCETDEKTGYSLESLAVHEAVALANKNVHDSSEANAQYRGMGTTVVVTLFYDNRFTVAHVGDSRLYRLRDAELELITRDHSLMQELIDRGFYTSEQARNSLNKNLVTRAIGIDENVQIDIQEDIAMIDDIYLLCSDGVTDMLEDDLIKSAIIEHENDLAAAAAKIIQLANKHGGKDNISALLIKPIKSFPAKNSLFYRFFDIFS
ncbi:Protein serine/threonine phosphatase PrpC, regulation of stationary phase [hydrothermal vent metagenome]|uniref:Protein serine/threonine phosphatase PrpC, regulation of stationary phase n=1 Tax=hydrothermal vent metagenome TaxID=652676 RepID=A0A3B0WNS3_9ZZZZ